MIKGSNNAVCDECGTIQKMGSGVIVCRACGEFGLTPIFASEDEARDHQDDRFADVNSELAYVHDVVGDDHYWFVERVG